MRFCFVQKYEEMKECEERTSQQLGLFYFGLVEPYCYLLVP
jgi:hypothetical protein